jgi:Flp pilus assembly protein TadG
MPATGSFGPGAGSPTLGAGTANGGGGAAAPAAPAEGGGGAAAPASPDACATPPASAHTANARKTTAHIGEDRGTEGIGTFSISGQDAARAGRRANDRLCDLWQNRAVRVFRHRTESPPRGRARRNGEAGASAVEFALIGPIFLAILFGIIDYGYYFYQRFAISAAVRDGVRLGCTYLSTTPPSGDAWSIARDRAKFILQQGQILDYTQVGWGPTAGSQYTTVTTANGDAIKLVTLSASYVFKPMIGLVPLPSAPMSYSMTMMLEQEN